MPPITHACVQNPLPVMLFDSQSHRPIVPSAAVQALPRAPPASLPASPPRATGVVVQNPMSVWHFHVAPSVEQSVSLWQAPWQNPIPVTVPVELIVHVYGTHLSEPGHPWAAEPSSAKVQSGKQIPCIETGALGAPATHRPGPVGRCFARPERRMCE